MTAGPAPFPAAAEPLPGGRGDGRFRWTGAAGLRLERGGVALAFDPFVTRPGRWATLFRRPRPDEHAAAARFSGLDAVFVGHAHYDHAMDLPAVARVSPRAVIHGGPVVVELARRLGVPGERLVEVADGRRYEVGPFTVEAIASRHGVVPVVRHFDRPRLPARGLPATPFRYPCGEVFAWRVEVEHAALHVQGSAGIDDAALDRQPRADVLIACLAARRGTPEYLARLARRLRPSVLVPCHHDDFFRGFDRPPRAVPTLSWRAFLADAEQMRERHGTRLWLPPFDREVPW